MTLDQGGDGFCGHGQAAEFVDDESIGPVEEAYMVGSHRSSNAALGHLAAKASRTEGITESICRVPLVSCDPGMSKTGERGESSWRDDPFSRPQSWESSGMTRTG